MEWMLGDPEAFRFILETLTVEAPRRRALSTRSDSMPSTSLPLAGQSVAVFGASSGIGLAVARGARALGARVTAIGRDRARLEQAVGADAIAVAACDITQEAALAALLRDLGALDHVVVTAGSVIGPSPLVALDVDVARAALDAKLFGSLLVAKHAAPRLRPGGSIGLTSGLLGRKVMPNAIIKTVINAGLEAAVRQLARELAPLRVYGVSPGPVDTPNWGPLSAAERAARTLKLAATLPVGFVASADDTAAAYLFAMQARALTGTIIDLDGGAMVGA
jgi:NAD(P)-dependent dehydrogenase (short-subunit alcohol dehydrogenase family)